MFYKKINKNEYNSEIWQNNIYYTNIIVIKDMIILEKINKREELSGGIIDNIMPKK